MASDLLAHPVLYLHPKLLLLADSPRFVEALADDWWLETVQPWLALPDLTEGIDEAWNGLLASAPEIPSQLDRPQLQKDASPAALHFSRVRKLAFTLLAVHHELGTASFWQHTSLGGDASLTIRIDSLEGGRFKLGRLRSVRWTPQPSNLRRFIADTRRPELIHAIESLLFAPIHGPEPERDFDRWLLLGPIRSFEKESRSPVTLGEARFPSAPAGYFARYGEIDLPEGCPLTTAAMLAPVFAAPCVRSCRLAANAPLPLPIDLLKRSADVLAGIR